MARRRLQLLPLVMRRMWMDIPTLPAPVPVMVLTGFLGAGKTTLLNQLLRADHGLRVAVLVNDFGSINVDTQLVVEVEDGAVSLANGCICCTLRDDMLDVVLQVLRRPTPPDYIVIEASGISDPLAIALTFRMPELRGVLMLDSVVAVVDAEQVDARHGYEATVIDQVSAADIVVLNKMDLVGEDRRGFLYTWVRQIVPRARILESTFGRVPLEFVMGAGKHRIALDAMAIDGHNHEHDHDHAQQFGTWSYTSETPLVLARLREVLGALPVSIYRGKGLVALADAPERRVIFHLVGRRVSLVVGEPWGAEPPRTQLVLIGTPDGVDAATLERSFAACHEGAPASPAQPAYEWVRAQP
ncbi:GTP-binding protein [Chloroflexia bacterium SDU3-3]|nr:GTP-binding protein [Chloroflexia bacterium SDU3-3]